MMKIKLNMNLLNYLKGTILTFTKEKGGLKLTSFWKRRIKDSAIDNCVTVLSHAEKVKKIKNKIKNACDGVVDVPEDPKEYYEEMGKEIDREEKQVKKSKKRKSK